MTILLISLAWTTALVGLVYLLAARPKRVPTGWERSPRLLANRDVSFEDRDVSFEEAISQMLRATPEAVRSKTAAAEHVGDGAQQDLYVRP
jgi:hypothetical protein